MRPDPFSSCDLPLSTPALGVVAFYISIAAFHLHRIGIGWVYLVFCRIDLWLRICEGLVPISVRLHLFDHFVSFFSASCFVFGKGGFGGFKVGGALFFPAQDLLSFLEFFSAHCRIE